MKISLNGKIVPAGEPVLPASSRGYRYGDGLFETMLVMDGRIRLADLHFQRLFESLSQLQYQVPPLFTRVKLQDEILQLCQLNQCLPLARVRLSVSRGNGGLYDEDQTLHYIIECWPLERTITRLNENGLVIGICPGVRKSCDPYSGLKSASFQPYSIAARYAKQQRLNDCLVLNNREMIADSTIANLFIIRQGVVITPPLADGCVKGVMRTCLSGQFTNAGYSFEERSVDAAMLAGAEEIFLTNAVQGIRWVRQYGDSLFNNPRTVEIYNRLVKTISS